MMKTPILPMQHLSCHMTCQYQGKSHCSANQSMVGQCAFSARSSAACCLMGSDLNSYNSDTVSAIQSAQSSIKSDGIKSASIHCVTLFFSHEFSHTNERKSYAKTENLSHSYVPCVLLFGLPLILQLLPLSNLIFICKSWLTSLVMTRPKLIQFT